MRTNSSTIQTSKRAETGKSKTHIYAEQERLDREELLRWLERYEDAFTPSFPKDFKDWHYNDPRDWVEVLKATLENLRERELMLEDQLINIHEAMAAFEKENESIAPLTPCLVVYDGKVLVAYAMRNGKFLQGELEIEPEWFCDAAAVTKLVGRLFTSKILENKQKGDKTNERK